ncbi:hypothetical protein RRG08_021519 [Elysia crispata]|uniref:Sushi domain-containing protein n=1 Tax=Elysia crispata TaxID=231223 RepID=A0AAE1BD30_9GAST|nr:hypothetical protein RRG08_021519 [Elysia crispata]
MPTSFTSTPNMFYRTFNTVADCFNLVRLYKNNEKLTTRYYTTEYQEYANGSLVFKCLTNYHVVEGDLELRCENNVFVGVEPRCEVDYYMEKQRLSAMIVLISLLLPATWLLVDFFRFMRLRKRRRLVSFKPNFNRSRVQIWIGLRELSILEKKYINAPKDSVDPSVSSCVDGQSRAYKSLDEFEDIFANKTVVKRTTVTGKKHDEHHFQLMGAARAFGKIGKILTKDLF